VLVAISFFESHWGYDQAKSGSYNAFGLMNSKGVIRFAGWTEGITMAANTVARMLAGGLDSIAKLYSGKRGAYCTHKECPDAVSTITQHLKAMGGNSADTSFPCEVVNGILVKKQ